MTLGSHQATIGKSQAHITPRHILDPLGHFDLDPCAAMPRPWSCAAINYTEKDNGLAQHWHGRVWLNPPFDRRAIAPWIARMAAHNNGIALVHARTETGWFQPIWQSAAAILFLAGRVTFCDARGDKATISDPASKHYGKPANSGAPVVLVAFGVRDADILAASGLAGQFVPLGYARRLFPAPLQEHA